MSYRESSFIDEIVVHVCKFCRRLTRECEASGPFAIGRNDWQGCQYKRLLGNLVPPSAGVSTISRPPPTSVPGPGVLIKG